MLLLNKEIYFLIKKFTTYNFTSAYRKHSSFMFFLKNRRIQPNTKGHFLITPVFGEYGRKVKIKKKPFPPRNSCATYLNLVVKCLET